MPRNFFLLLMSTLCSFAIKAERILETVLDPANPQQQSVAYRGKLLIAGHGDSYLLSYDDLTFTRTTFPLVSGVRLQFDSYKNPLTHFESAIFFALRPTTGTSSNRYLFRYSGGFTRISITGNIISNCMVYGSYLYFLSDVSGTTRLYRYTRGVVTEVAGAAIPRASGYELHVSGGNMYITGYATRTGTVNFIRRYNGTSFLTLPWSAAGTNVEGVYAIPGTTRVYFISHERILYYNGTTVRQVFFNTGEHIYARLWQNDLFLTTGVGAIPGRISYVYRLSGASLASVSLPAGYQVAPVPHTNPEIYEGSLYLGATLISDGTAAVLRYDGTAFRLFYTIPTPPVLHSGIGLYLREGNLIIHPTFTNGKHAFEYNGSDFTEIIAPTDRLLFPYINSTACNHLWLNYYSDVSGIHWAYGKESKDCPPPPPPPGPVAVIPDHFMDFERFDMSNYGPERGWCWSEIIIDWEIVPICPLPPCPEPTYEVRMFDANNGIAWSEKFSKPSFFKVPLPDEQPFKTVLYSVDTKRDLLVFEPELIPKGIEIIKVNLKPKEGIFMLTASTRKNAVVPLKVTLLNADGKILWEQTFSAPFSQLITAKVREPGKTLVFSIPNESVKLVTRPE